MAISATAWAEVKTGIITGTVKNLVTLEPLPGAAVIVVGTRLGASSNAEGNFTISKVPVGIYTVRVQLLGYEPNAKNDVVVDNVMPVSFGFALRESPVDIDPIFVTPDYFAKTPDMNLSTQMQSGEEIRRLPGSFEDVVRATSILPGVAQPDGGRNDLVVRGGAPSENLYLIGDLEANNINHFGTQGSSGGPLSFINLDYVDHTAFSTGGFGVRYGDKLSSVLDIDLRDGRSDKLGIQGTLSATSFGFDLEGPIAEKGSYISSIRRSWLDVIFKSAGFSFVPEYWDFLTKIDYRLSKSDKLNILATGAIDNVKFFNDDSDNRYDNSDILGSDQNQAITGITWQHLLHKGYINFSGGFNYVDFYYQQNDSLLQPIFRNSSTEQEFYIKTELTYQLSGSLEMMTGFKVKNIRFESDALLPSLITDFGDTITLDKNFETLASKAGSFVQFSFSHSRFRTTFGGRLDYFDLIRNKYAISPRLSNLIKLSERTNLSFSIGRYYQSPSYISLIANPINRQLSFLAVDQYIGGLEYLLWPDTKVSIESYYKRYFNYPSSLTREYLILANTGAGFGGAEEGFASFGLDQLTGKGKGRARGLELFIQKKLSEIPCYGLVSISLGETKFTAVDGIERPSSWDQRWIINIGGGYIFNADWEIATRFRYASGRPYTPFNADGSKDESSYNSVRTPSNHSLDLRLDKRWMFNNWMMITYIDIQNIYNRPQKGIPDWDDRESALEENESIGILPSIGITFKF